MKRWPLGRGLAGLLAGMVAAGALVIGSAGPAAAHARLKSITPEHDSVQTATPSEVVLTFNERINRRYTEIRVTGPGDAAVTSGEPATSGPKVRQRLKPLPKPGRYTVAYRTVSVDGHVISGSRKFTYRPAASPPATPVPGAAGSGQAGQPDQADPAGQGAAGSEQPGGETSEQSPWVLVALGAVAAALVTGAVLAVRRGRRDS